MTLCDPSPSTRTPVSIVGIAIADGDNLCVRRVSARVFFSLAVVSTMYDI